MAIRHQNVHSNGQVPGYYNRNRVYPNSYARADWGTRVGRRVHDGFSLTRNYGLDTVADDENSSPYSSPYYVNGRYNSLNLVTQRGNSASVQGVKFLTSYKDEYDDFTEEDIQTTIRLWQGKQIKFELPYNGKIVGNTLKLRNTGGCTGILSIYISAEEDALPIYETSVDLCTISEDIFEKVTLRAMTPVPARANSIGKVFVRMEIWDEIDCKRSDNPFNTYRIVEIAATGAGNHEAANITFGPKNVPANKETYDFQPVPNRPLMGLIYNEWESIPVDRVGDQKTGASVSDQGYRYDIFCITDGNHSELIIYNKEENLIVENTNIRVDSRAEYIQIAQVVDTDRNNWVYYVDGYSPLQRFKIGEWVSQKVVPASGDVASQEPVNGPSLILFHNNRLYIGGFLHDKNLFQCSAIEADGPNYTSFPYRFYAPNNSPYALSTNTATAMVEFRSDTIMIMGKNFYSLFGTNTAIENTSSSNNAGMPQQTSTYMDAAGCQSAGDIVNYKGIVYSFDPREGIRRFSGGVWHVLENSVQSHFDRVDMDKPRKLWGFANRLYFNYTDKVDGKAKALMWDMTMNYQQYPWFQDIDLPFCDVRYDESEQLIGIHPDYPCIMELYAEDTWRRLDTPIVFERHTKYLSVPGNGHDSIVKRVHNEVLSNANRWWWIGLSVDKQYLTQQRGRDIWYRIPCWATRIELDPVEAPFNSLDIYEEEATLRLNINNLRIQCLSIQCKVKAKTFRDQASLISTQIEVGVRQFN